MPGWSWPEVIAHRRSGALAPENTLAGLAIAARLGCRAVEFDVMLARDGVPVLIHDETLDRCASVAGRVVDLDGAQLMATDVGARFHAAFVGETIPGLDAALQRCRQLGLAANLEIKPAAGHEVATGRAVGLRVLVYTVNDPADARRLAGWGVSGVFTDRPDLLLDAIR